MKRALFSAFLLGSVNFTNAQVNPCQRAGMPYSSVPGDTTITLPSGTQITFNRCEYFDIRDCLDITEITDTAGLNRAGLTMRDDAGNVLETCGMLKIQLNDCGKTCFDIPIIIKVRIRFQDCGNTSNTFPGLYIANGNVWSEQPPENVKKITQDNIQYLEFRSKCGVTINCDIKRPNKKVKFIAPAGQKIKQLRIGRNCPLFVANDNFVKPKRKAKTKIFCGEPDKTTIQAVIINQQNEQASTEQKKLSDLRAGKAKIKCSVPKKTFLGRLFDWRKKTKSNTSKKYYL